MASLLCCIHLTIVLMACCPAIQMIQWTRDGNFKASGSLSRNLRDSVSISLIGPQENEPPDSASTDSIVESSISASTDSTKESFSPSGRDSTGRMPYSDEVSLQSNFSRDGMMSDSPFTSLIISSPVFAQQNLDCHNYLQQWEKNYPPYRQNEYIATYKRNVEDATSKLLVVGGHDVDGQNLNDTWIYTPWSNSWLEVTTGSRLPPVYARGYQVLPTVCDTFVPLINGINDVWLFDGRTETWSQVATVTDSDDDFLVEGTVALRHSSCASSNCSCSESVFVYGRIQMYPGYLRLCPLFCMNSHDGQLSCSFKLHPNTCKLVELKDGNDFSCETNSFIGYGIMSAADDDRRIIYFLSRRLPDTFQYRKQTRLFRYDVQNDKISSQVILHKQLSFQNVLVWNNSLLLLFDLYNSYSSYAVSLKNISDYKKLTITEAPICGVPSNIVQTDHSWKYDVILKLQPALPIRFHWKLPSQPQLYEYRAISDSNGSYPSFIEIKKGFPPQQSPGLLRYHTSVYDYDTQTFYVYGGRSYNHGQEQSNTSAANLWTLTMPFYTWWLIKPSTTPTSYISNCGTYSRSNVILFGGKYDDGSVGKELWIYNPNQRVWTQSVPIKSLWPESRASCSLTATTNGTTIVLFGGLNGAKEAMSDVWSLQIRSNFTAEWLLMTPTVKDSTKRMPLPRSRFDHSSIVVKNLLVIYGGNSNAQGGSGYVYLFDMWAFNIDSKSWREITVSPKHDIFGNAIFTSIKDTSHSYSFLLPYGKSRIVVLNSISQGESLPMSDFAWIVDTKFEKPTDLQLFDMSLFPQAAGIWNGSLVYYGNYLTSEEIMNEVLVAVGGKCDPGNAQLRRPTESCLPCPIGRYSLSHLTISECTECPPGTTTKRPGSISVKNCTCDVNYCVHGTCELLQERADNTGAVCRCSFGFVGQQCDHVNYVVFVLTFGILTVVVAVTTVLSCCGVRTLRHRRARRQTEWELQETRRVFTVMPREIELISRLDEDCPGGYGQVYKAIYRDLTVAIKQLQVVMAEWADIRKEFLREIQFMRTVRHPNIVMFIGAGQYGNNQPFLVLEFLIGGALRSLLQNSAIDLTTKDKHNFMVDTAEGMKYLHTLQPPRIHRDLKSANLLLSSRWQVKVADFGSARLMPHLNQNTSRQRSDDTSNNEREEASEQLLNDGSQLTNRRIGTPRWRSPEMWRQTSYGTATDVYSFGVVMWEIVTRQTPFSGSTYRFDAKVEDAVLSGTRPTIPDDTTRHLRSLIQQCWQENSQDRPTFPDIVLQLESMLKTMEQPGVNTETGPGNSTPAQAASQFNQFPCFDPEIRCIGQGELHELVTLQTSSA